MAEPVRRRFFEVLARLSMLAQHLRLTSGHLTETAGGHLAICPAALPCSNCNVGTTHLKYQVVMGSNFTNGSCTNCTALNGATILLTQDPANACHWSGTIYESCTYQCDLWTVYNGPECPGPVWCGRTAFTIVNAAGGTAYLWDAAISLPTDCSSFTLAYDTANFLNGYPGCNPDLDEVHGNVTLTGL